MRGGLRNVAPLLILLGGAAACEDKHNLAPLVKAPGQVSVLESGGVEGDTGWWPSVAFDASGNPHLSFCNAYEGDLQYATRHQGQWQLSTVVKQGAVGKYTAIAVNPKGGLGIVFYDQDTKYLRYAWRSDTPGAPEKGEETTTAVAAAPARANTGETAEPPWRTERIAWGLEVGMAAELRFDQQGVPHVFYYIPSGKLIHAWRPKAGQWEKEVVYEATGSFSIRIDPVLRPDGFWVSFVHWSFTDTTLYLARPNPKPAAGEGAFRVEVVDQEQGPGWRSQLVFWNNEPWVVYTRTRKPQLRVAHLTGEGWQSRLLIPAVANFAATLTPEGDLIAAYEDIERGGTGKGLVRYLRTSLTDPQAQVRRWDLDPSGPTGAYLTVDYHPQGGLVLPYYSGEIKGLKIYEER